MLFLSAQEGCWSNQLGNIPLPFQRQNCPSQVQNVARSAGVVAFEINVTVSDHPALRAPLLYQEGSSRLQMVYYDRCS